MIRKVFLILLTICITSGFGRAQSFVKTPDLFQRREGSLRQGQLNIIQDTAIDSLISRYILANSNKSKDNNHPGMEGFRIQIYRSSVRNAREESNKARAEFISKFQDLPDYKGLTSYILYDKPGWYMVRVGDFRTRTEATGLFLLISKEFPDSYIVPDFINFPDLNTK
jgi:hypothetical protein